MTARPASARRASTAPAARRSTYGRPAYGRPASVRHLVVDPIACDGHGVCAELLPEWVVLDDWGYPMLREGVVPRHLLGKARWAVSNCPALALKLERKESA